MQGDKDERCEQTEWNISESILHGWKVRDVYYLQKVN